MNTILTRSYRCVLDKHNCLLTIVEFLSSESMASFSTVFPNYVCRFLPFLRYRFREIAFSTHDADFL